MLLETAVDLVSKMWWCMGDTPQTVLTTRAAAVLKNVFSDRPETRVQAENGPAQEGAASYKFLQQIHHFKIKCWTHS